MHEESARTSQSHWLPPTSYKHASDNTRDHHSARVRPAPAYSTNPLNNTPLPTVTQPNLTCAGTEAAEKASCLWATPILSCRHAVFPSPLACLALAYLTPANTFYSRAASSHATGFRASCDVSPMDFKQGLPHIDFDLVLWSHLIHLTQILSLSSFFFLLHLSGTDMSRTGAKLVTGTHLSLVHEGVILWKPWCAIQQLK